MLGLSQPEEHKSLTFLIDNSFKGVQDSLKNPFFGVHKSFICMHVTFSFLNQQLFHPLKAREYAQTARALRSIGRDCIKKRIELVESEAEVPNDILTHILQVACKLQ